MNKQIDNRIVVIAFIFLICVALLGFTAYSIKLTYDTNAQINEKTAAANDLSQQIARLRSIKEKSTQMDNVVAQANDKIPAIPDEPGILEFFKSITADGTLTGITFDERVNNDIATEMPFTVTIISTYSVMMKVIDSIASADRYYSIESIDINKTEDGELSYSMSISAYFNSGTTSVVAVPSETTSDSNAA